MIEDFPLDRFADRYREVGDLTRGIDESAGRLDTLLEWVARDEEEYGQGDAPWPPQYPKVTGEPPRVQPSRRRAEPLVPTAAGETGANYTIEQYLSGRSPTARAYWDRLVELARRCGEFQFAPAKTRSGFMLRARFLVVFALSDRGASFGISLANRREHPRFRRIDQVGAHEYFHQMRVNSLEELDDEVGNLICEAYQWGLVGAK
jgi:hypothetical protein